MGLQYNVPFFDGPFLFLLFFSFFFLPLSSSSYILGDNDYVPYMQP